MVKVGLSICRWPFHKVSQCFFSWCLPPFTTHLIQTILSLKKNKNILVVVFSFMSLLYLWSSASNHPALMTQFAALGLFCVCMCRWPFLSPVWIGRGGGREQTEHQDQSDAKADPAPGGGDSHTNTLINADTTQHKYVLAMIEQFKIKSAQNKGQKVKKERKELHFFCSWPVLDKSQKRN